MVVSSFKLFLLECLIRIGDAHTSSSSSSAKNNVIAYPVSTAFHPGSRSKSVRKVTRELSGSLTLTFPKCVQAPKKTRQTFAATPRSFDLSPTWEWEHFFQDGEDTELHPSASTLLELIPHPPYDEEPTSLLMIGCGTSHLPSHISDRYPHCRLILMDSSQTCMNILKERYAENKQISFTDKNFNYMLRDEDEKVDFVYDLGLMDALLRGEEWEGEVSVLLQRISEVLSYRGRYALVSYELPYSIQEFLIERGADVELEWTFVPINGIEGVEVSRAMLR